MRRPMLTLVLLIGLWAGLSLTAQAHPPAVASAHPAATSAGMQALAAGGNAFDAAVAVSAALAVVEPQSSGLGGGGFWLLHVADGGRNVMIDGREKAPAAATSTMYQDDDGHVLPRASLDGGLAAGIPGEPAALAHIAEQYGNLPLKQSLAPAIRLARDGFHVNRHMHDLIAWRADVIRQHPAIAELLLTDDGQPLPTGTLLRQPALADTLTALARNGRAGFYTGPVAHKLVAGVSRAGGIWTLDDLADYRIKERQPIVGHYDTPHGPYKIVSAAPPSSGGIVLLEALHILQGFDWAALSDVRRIHVAVEAMRRAYRDRAAWLGDADFVDIPLQRLLSPQYAAGLRVGIHPGRATPSKTLAPVTGEHAEGSDTTHFSIVDRHGNRVAATLSVNYPFGAGVMPAGTGVIINDEMDDFSAKPLTPNVYGLVDSKANAIAPGKRPLSSMSPTFVVGPKRTAVLGTPGGSRIISMVLLGTLTFAHGGDAEDIVSRPRYHHQYLPDVIQYEPGAFTAAQKADLRAMGYTLKNVGRHYGDMQTIVLDRKTDTLNAASDPRGMGMAVIGPNTDNRRN